MFGIKKIIGFTLFGCLTISSFSQTKPSESTSKLKRVLHYNKIGGWRHEDGIKELTDVLNILSKKKGFELIHSTDVSQLNLANLKTYSAIVWDNNTNGALSVPDDGARKAVLEYVNQGGGWLLIHGAGDHGNTWPELQSTLGTTFSIHGAQGKGEITFDSEALNHKELKWMLQGLPPKATLTKDEWYSFENTVRGLPGVTVIATSGGGDISVLPLYTDGSVGLNRTYSWAKVLGKGRTLYTALGHGQNQLYAQADSFATKSLYEHLRYVAGDFQDGCTNKSASNFDSSARVDNNTCVTTGISNVSQTGNELQIRFQNFKSQSTALALPFDGKFSLELRNAVGKVVWFKKGLNIRNVEISTILRPGVYYVKAINGNNTITQKILSL